MATSPSLLSLLLKGLLLGVFALIVDYLFIGLAFHGYQRLTPQTWRPEGPRNYGAATAVDLLFGIGFAFFFSSYRIALGVDSAGRALAVGATMWALFVLPVLLSVGIFVNWHTAVWLALMADWLVILCGVSLISSFLV